MTTAWRYGEPENGVLKVTIDCPDRPVNVFSRSALEELDSLIDFIQATDGLRGVLFQSGKPGVFIAGADVTEWKDLKGYDEVHEVASFGQKVFGRLAALQIPTVALISGACLGGGLEFALACKYRIADEQAKTLLAFPEVKLGLIPGWGGTVRVRPLVGLSQALAMVMTGKMLNGRQAAKCGLIHDSVPTEALESVGERVLSLVEEGRKVPVACRPKPWWKTAVENSAPYRALAFSMAKRQVLAKSHGHYPAPIEALNAVREGYKSAEAGFAAETDAVARLAQNDVTTECVRLFFLSTEAKKSDSDADSETKQAPIQQAAVIGAGAMGAGIALLLARKGIWTQLKDVAPPQVAAGMKTIRKFVNKDRQRKRITPVQATDALDHISPTTDYRGLKHADVVIEAIVENLDVKRKVFQEIAEAANPKTVLATNTSSLLVGDIAQAVPHPDRVVGLHFFNPPHQMPVVDVIRA
ncbi:MAG: 3-hydroxyacyl-CoA dehydrogenase NAD-binding domain-containing protein, partial [Planctomycetales bacterium]